MKWMEPEFDNRFSLGDDAWLQRGEGVKNLGKSDYIIIKCSLAM